MITGLDGFIVTADGHEVSMAAPLDSPLTPLAIAWALSQLNRFTGHALRPYSVAEHSLLVCEIVARDLGGDVHAQLAALLHDAHESVTGDLHSPGKGVVGPAWHAWEWSWERIIRDKFSVVTAFGTHRATIQRADAIALATERRDLMPTFRPGMHREWPRLAGVRPVEWVALYDEARTKASWEDWRDRWLDKLHELIELRGWAPANLEGATA
jgi:hypothetical protein